MRNLDELIERATHHVEDGRRIVAAHRQRIANGKTAPGAYDLLASFEETQALFEADLAREGRTRQAEEGLSAPSARQ